MKRSFFFLLVIGFIFTTSCRSTIMRIAGLRKPKIESKASIFKFLIKLKEDTNDVFTLDSVLLQKLRKEQFKPGMARSFRPVQIRVYGKSGEPVMQWASCEGYLSDLKIFDSVPPKIINGLNTSLKGVTPVGFTGVWNFSDNSNTKDSATSKPGGKKIY